MYYLNFWFEMTLYAPTPNPPPPAPPQDNDKKYDSCSSPLH